jgi:CRP-like cAMP-binding protein
VSILQSGVAKLIHRCDDGTDTLVGVRGAGTILLSAHEIETGHHSTTAIAMVNCRTTAIPFREFERLRGLEPGVNRWLLASIAAADFDTVKYISALSRSFDCRTRVEAILLAMFRSAGTVRSDGSVRLDIPLSIQDLAELCGYSRDQVSRAIVILASENVISRSASGWFNIPVGSIVMPVPVVGVVRTPFELGGPAPLPRVE